MLLCICTRRSQLLHDLDEPLRYAGNKGVFPHSSIAFGFSIRFQLVDHVRVAMVSREHERRLAMCIPHVHVGLGIDQHAHR